MSEAADARSGPIAHREAGALLGLVLLALAVHVLAVARHDRVAWGDEPFYLWLGQSLWHGTGYQLFGYSGTHFPPLFAAVAGGLAPLSGGLIQASNVVYILSTALLVLPLYLTARSIYGRLAAAATGLMVAVYPALATGVLAWGTMTEPLYLLWVALAIYALVWTMETGKMVGFLALGAALGLAYLTRTEALVFAILAVVLLVAVRLARRDRVGPVLTGAVVAALVFLFIASPYLVYLRNQTGRWSLTGAAGMAYVSMEGLADDDAASFDRATWELDPNSGEVYLFAPASEDEGLLSAIAADPMALVRRLRANARDALALLISVKLVAWPLVGLVALGLFGRSWDGRELRGQLALMTSLASPLAYVPFFVQERYLAGFLLPSMIWIGAGAAFLGKWLIGTWTGLRRRELSQTQTRVLGALPALLVAGFLVSMSPRLWTLMQRTHSFQPGHLAAATALNALDLPHDTVLMSRYPAIALHAGMSWTPTPAESWPEVAAYANLHNARFLAIDGWEATLRPQLSFLLIPSQAPPELRHLATIEAGPDPVIIYEFQ